MINLLRTIVIVVLELGTFSVEIEPGNAQTASPTATIDQGPIEELIDDPADKIIDELLNKEQGLERQEKFAEAIPLAQRLLELTKETPWHRHPNTAGACLILGALYCKVANYTEAAPLLSEWLRAYDGIENDEAARAWSLIKETVQNLVDQGSKLHLEGRDLDAIPLAKALLTLERQALPADDPHLAEAICGLGALCFSNGQSEQAESLLADELGRMRKMENPPKDTLALVLLDLGEVYAQMGDYSRAGPLMREGLQLSTTELRPELKELFHVVLARVLTYYKGDYLGAEPVMLEAQQAVTREFGQESKEAAEFLGELGDLYALTGDYAKAEQYYKEAIEIEKNVYGRESREVALSLNQLGRLYGFYGDVAGSVPLYLEALRILKDALGDENDEVAFTLTNLGSVYIAMQDYHTAAKVFSDALTIEKKFLGSDDSLMASTEGGLGVAYVALSDPTDAEPLLKDALRIREEIYGNTEKVFGSENLAIALARFSLVMLYGATGRVGDAAQLAERVLEVYRKTVGNDNPSAILACRELALLDLDLQRGTEAKALAREAWSSEARLFANVLTFASEQQRLGFQGRFSLDVLSALISTGDNEDAAALEVLRKKGAVLDSLIEDQAFYRANRKTAGGEDLLKKLALIKERIGRLLLEAGQPSAESKKQLQKLEEEKEAIESNLAKNVTVAGITRRALSVTTEQVIATLPGDAALIEYFYYGPYLDEGRWELACGAVVFLQGQKPIVVTLPAGKLLRPTISRYICLVDRDAPQDNEELVQKLRQLYLEAWEPVQKVLPSTVKRVLISPDGQTNFISFAALLDSDQRFLGEKLIVEYVSTGRDLLETTVPEMTDKDCVVVANPDFDNSTADLVNADAPSVVKMRGSETRDLLDLNFDPLSGTARELGELQKRFASWNWKLCTLSGRAATKAALFELHHPYILHVATHGFFAPVSAPNSNITDLLNPEDSRNRYFDNPMHRSGLALAGANRTVAAWRYKKEVTAENDGILTAEDAAGLDLHGTWLVALAACDSGEGEPDAGEGVLGLRRGFLEAGAQNLLMTLWPVADENTVEFMADFYARASESENAPLALAEVQRDWLVKLRKEKGLAEAARSAGPFILTFKGKP